MNNTQKEFWRSVGKRGPINSQPHPKVTIREMALWHPNSVYQSLLDRANWIAKLSISAQAKRLTRLSGHRFLIAVEDILTSDKAMRHGRKRQRIDASVMS